MMVGGAGKTQVSMPQRAWICARTAHSIRHAFAGMLPQARAARLRTRGGYERTRSLPFAGAFDLLVSFGAFGHFPAR